MTDLQTRVAVGLSEGLPDVLNRLRQAAGKAVALEIPEGSSLFLTASEFRALQAAADRDRIAITVSTDDPLRQQLAALFKLPVTAPVAEAGSPAPGPETAVATTTPAPAAKTAEGHETAEGNAVPANAASPIARDGDHELKSPGQPSVPEQSAETSSGEQPTEPAAAVSPEAPSRLTRAKAWMTATTRRQRVIAVATLIGVVAVAYVGSYLFLTRATVVLTLKRQAIARSIDVAVAAPGVTAPGTELTIAATPVSIDVSASKTTNVTGSKTVGEATAQGKISLSNPTDKPVTVDAGTQLEDKITGTKYTIVATVALPAGQGGAPAFGEAAVTCLEPGTVGNRDVGMLSGRLANGVYFSNRSSPIAGGTDKQVPVVAQADLDALQAKAIDDMKAQAAGRSPGGDLVVLAPSIQLGGPSFATDHKVGDESATVTVQATARASALAYRPSELRARVADALAATVPPGYQLDRSSLQLSDLTAANGNAQAVVLILQASGSATAALTPDDKKRIAAAVAGGDERKARAHLATLTMIDGFEIRYSPGWLPHRIPSTADRVRIETR